MTAAASTTLALPSCRSTVSVPRIVRTMTSDSDTVTLVVRKTKPASSASRTQKTPAMRTAAGAEGAAAATEPAISSGPQIADDRHLLARNLIPISALRRSCRRHRRPCRLPTGQRDHRMSPTTKFPTDPDAGWDGSPVRATRGDRRARHGSGPPRRRPVPRDGTQFRPEISSPARHGAFAMVRVPCCRPAVPL